MARRRNRNRANQARNSGFKGYAGPLQQGVVRIIGSNQGSTPRGRGAARKRNRGGRARGTRVSAGGGQIVSAITRSLCSFTNAFCEDGVGAKYPDTNQARTVVIPIAGLISVPTDANGAACFAFVPAFPYGYSGYTSTSGGVATMPNLTAWGGSSTFTPSETRFVNLSVKIQSTCAPLSASGAIVVAEVSGSDNVALTTIDLNAVTAYQHYRNFPLANYDPIYWHAYRGGEKCSEFEPANTATIGTVDTNDWPVLVVGVVSGPASTTVARIEYKGYVECKFPISSAFNSMATPPAASNPGAIYAANEMARKSSPIVAAPNERTANAIVEQAAMQAAASIVKGGAAAAGAWIGGEPGAKIGSVVGDYYANRYLHMP